MSKQGQHGGFTLLELMVAIAVFAVLGLMSSQLLGNIVRQHGVLEDRGKQLIDLQRAMGIMQRDIGQIVARKIRDQYGDSLGAIIIGEELPLEFTRTGWRNPLGHQRSNLQRVAYAVSEGNLYRYYWPVLDRSPDTEPLEQLMLEGVLDVEFSPLDGNGDRWRPENAQTPDPRLSLAAISARFELQNFGEVSRLWELPELAIIASSVAVNPGSDSDSDANNVSEGRR
jgi:general secretion pathway protein J